VSPAINIRELVRKIAHLEALNFQTDFHTSISLLEKFFEEEPCIYKCRYFLKCHGETGDRSFLSHSLHLLYPVIPYSAIAG
jgi:hypothetical protein